MSLKPAMSDLLTKFWEIEQVPSKSLLTPAEQYCESLFESTTVRKPNDSYCMKLPFSKTDSFPDSRNIAVACLLRSAKIRQRKEELNRAYTHFMKEYLALGHME